MKAGQMVTAGRSGAFHRRGRYSAGCQRWRIVCAFRYLSTDDGGVCQTFSGAATELRIVYSR